MTLQTRLRIVFFGFLAGLSPSAWSVPPDSSLEAMARQIEALNSQIHQLQAQVDTLAKQAAEAQSAAAAAQGAAVEAKGAVADAQASVEAHAAEAALNSPRLTYHLAGYSFVNYVVPQSGSSAFTQGSFNPILHALYDDRILFEGELEIGETPDGSTEVALEYASIAWLFNDHAALVAGRFLSPLGFFRQNLHPAWINRMASPPPGFGHDGAASSGELGVQIRGGWSTTPIGRVNYAVFVGNGPEIEAGEEGLMGVMTEGVPRNIDGSMVAGGRFGWLPVPTLEFGLSWADGNTSVTGFDGADIAGDPSRSYGFQGADMAWRPMSNLELRSEYARQRVGAAASSVAPDAATWRAWYVQSAYRFGTHPWELVARYGEFTTPETDEAFKQTALGVNFWLSPSAAIRANYEFNDPAISDSEIEDRLLVQMAYGF